MRQPGGSGGSMHSSAADKTQQPSAVTDASFGFINGCVGIPIMISFASIVFKVRLRMVCHSSTQAMNSGCTNAICAEIPVRHSLMTGMQAMLAVC